MSRVRGSLRTLVTGVLGLVSLALEVPAAATRRGREALVSLGVLPVPLLIFEFANGARWRVESCDGDRSYAALAMGHRRMEREWKPGQPLPLGVELVRLPDVADE